MDDYTIPTVVNADLSSFYMVRDPSPGPEEVCEVREIVVKALNALPDLKRRIILLLMAGGEPKNIATYLGTHEMSVTRAKRSFLSNLRENGMDI